MSKLKNLAKNILSLAGTLALSACARAPGVEYREDVPGITTEIRRNFPIESTSPLESKTLEFTFYMDEAHNIEDPSLELLNGNQADVKVDSSAYRDPCTVEVLSKFGKVLYKNNFAPSFMILSDPPIMQDYSQVSLRVPFSKDARYVAVYHNGRRKAKVNIPRIIKE
ncbi:MAG: hypothetical protein NT076_05545 [Candidatus Pacearchaeota archaeon]|nr:hypothetical protein [Candidatus Pacearchaeota archaeon]